MSKVLKFSYEVQNLAFTGRELLAALNSRALTEVFDTELIELNAKPEKSKNLLQYFLALFAWLDGLDQNLVENCIRTISKENINAIYIEGSNYGKLAKAVKLAVPSCKVVTFFHNVEARFFWGAFKHNPTIRGAAVLMANTLAEHWAVKYSDRIICLNNRDSQMLNKIYGRYATDINPLCIDDSNESKHRAVTSSSSNVFGLFVGGAFYANVSGVRWFAQHVAHLLPCLIFVVGRGFEEYSSELERYPNIKVVGMVEHVEEWYQRASFVIAPIFDGSGMKTKVAEALMYGRPVVGSSEAFVGYEDVVADAGIVCNNEDEFVTGISEIYTGQRKYDSTELRNLFDNFYSFSAAKKNLAAVFDHLFE